MAAKFSFEEEVDELYGVCDVCEVFPPKSGSLHCRHTFCHDCFKRYVNGSLDELNNYLRCCVCGDQSDLTQEDRSEVIHLKFGRDEEPKLADPIGLCRRKNGDFVTIDRQKKRGYIFSRHGEIREDFSYIHETFPMDGIAVTSDDKVVASFKGTHRDVITYFLSNGDVMTSSYINQQNEDIDITGMAVNSRDWIVAADCKNSALFFIHPQKRHVKSVELMPCAGEKVPEPRGITINNQDDIIVTDWANDCVRVLDPTGGFKFKFGSHGQRPGQFSEPYGIAVDEEDRIFVAEKGNNRVQIFTPEGEFIRYLVRYKQGRDVYLAPFDLVCLGKQHVAVLLAGIRDARAAEIRIYPYILDLY